MGGAVLPLIIDAFDRSRRRHAVEPDRIADVGCGTGRFLRYLTRTGAELVGVDRSPAMLRLARRNLAGANVRLLRQDIRSLRLPAPVDCLTCTFDTLNYMCDPGDLSRVLGAFFGNLLPGGWLLFDYIPRAVPGEASVTRQIVHCGPIASIWQIRTAADGSGSKVKLYIRERLPDGAVRRVVETHRQRWHAPEEIRAALAATGFMQVETRPMDPEGSGNWRHVVARRGT